MIAFICNFTSIFSAGLIPWYVVCVNWYGLRNNILALILPSLFSVWYMFLMRTYFKAISPSLYDAAKIDGAGHWTIFFRIALPLSVTALLTVGLMYALCYWNDWWHALMFIDDRDLFPASPLVMQKSCHDMDLMVWLTGSKCESISSFGDLTYFKAENAPENAAERCAECPLKDSWVSTFLMAVERETRLKDWKIIPIFRRKRRRLFPFKVMTSVPSTVSWPSVTSIIRLMVRISVDLPAPLRPMMATNSP